MNQRTGSAVPRRGLDHWLTLRRWQRRSAGMIIVALLLVLAIRGGWRPWVDARRSDRVAGRVVAIDGQMRIVVEGRGGERRRFALAGLRTLPRWQAASRQWLAEQLVGRSVRCTLRQAEAGSERGRSRRAFVYVDEDGTLINEAMIDAGYAAIDPAFEHELGPWFAQVRDWAAEAGRGLWARGSPVD